jgi:3-hydroxypropionyl-coenzyme A dehydratase
MSESPLRVEQADGVLHLTLDRPAKRNALSAELRQCLVDTLGAAATDDSVGAVVLSGAGGSFCAGFDLDELAATADPAALFTEANLYHHTVHTFPKPIVAAIEGFAVAGGFDLALMCDLRVTGDEATFGHPQVRHGIPTNFELLASVIAGPAARDLCLTGRRVDAAQALQLGLAHRVVPAGDAVDAALALAADIAGLSGSIAMKQAFLAHQPDLFPIN